MSARREKHTGRNGAVKWRWVVDFTYQHPEGSRERVRKISPISNRRGAEEYERQLRQAFLASGSHQKQEVSPIMAEFAQTFLLVYAAANNKPSEKHTKSIILRVHLVPALGSKRLDEITARDIEQYKATKKKDFSAKTLNNHLSVLSMMLKTAEEWGIIDEVPRIKRLKAAKPTTRFLDFAQANALVAAVEHRWREMVVIALNTGLRLGELLALRWVNVDLKQGVMVVCENDWKGQIGTPKGNVARHVPLNQAAREALMRQKTLVPKGAELVFCNVDGKRITYQSCRKPLMRACRKADIPMVQWHALRHSFASHLSKCRVAPKDIQDLLGHVTLTTTQRYIHSTTEAARQAVAALDLHGTLMAPQESATKNWSNIN